MAKKDQNKSLPEKVGDALKGTAEKIKETADTVGDRLKEKTPPKKTPVRK